MTLPGDSWSRTGGPDLSIILPCYRAGELACRSVSELVPALENSGYSWEVIVVDDGGGDLADSALPADGRVRLIRLPVNQGKGAAVRAGMLAATGRVRVYTDVDLPYDTSLLIVAARYVLERGFHMVVGDRTLPTARYAKEISRDRRIASSAFSAFVGKLVTGGFFDTQCGLKAMRGDIAQLVFRFTRINRFAFDVEVLYIALIARLDIKRIPVELRNNDTSSVRLVRDSAQMLFDVFRMKYYRLRRHYPTTILDEIVSADFEALRAADHHTVA